MNTITKFFRKNHFLFGIIFTIIIVANTNAQDIKSTDDIAKFTNAIFDEVNKANAVASLHSVDWSTSFIGNFPHFGFGYNAALAASNIGKTIQLFSGQGSLSIEDYPGIGVASNVDVRVGGFNLDKLIKNYPKIPFDLGLHVMYIPDFEGQSSLLSGLSMLNLGGDIRMPIFEEQRLIPGLTFSFTYFFNQFTIKQKVAFGNLFPSFGIQYQGVRMKLGDSLVTAESSSHVFGFKFQTSKLLLFFEPYFGVEPYVGTVTGTVKSDGLNIQIDDGGNTNNAQFKSYKDYLASGGSALTNEHIDFSNDKLEYTHQKTLGGLRIYTGFGLVIFSWITDFGISYDPFHEILSANVSTRISF